VASDTPFVTDATRHVLVAGIGDDGPDGLPPALRARIDCADLLVGGRRHLDFFPDATGERWTIAGDLKALLDRLATESEHCRIVVLASGDPCFFGIGPLLARRLGAERVEIVPGASAVALAFARLGLPWHDATVVSAHGRPLEPALHLAQGAQKLAVLTDETNTPAVIARALLDRGTDDAPAYVFEHLGGVAERSVHEPLSGIAEQRFAALNVLVVPQLAWPQTDRRFGRPESSFAHSRGMITKPEVRAVSLSKLALQDGDVLWDIGAGSGSIAIEAAGLIPDLTAFAIERSEEQVDLLRRNLARCPASAQVTVVYGEAPDVLRDLPAPDAVFLGGSGGHLRDLLMFCAHALRPGGRIVANVVALEHVSTILTWARERRHESELVQVSVARGADILTMTRLDAQNPVFVVTVTV
jgi:precorrin-6Y C5,15-methyltransferase (decarboxylating)